MPGEEVSLLKAGPGFPRCFTVIGSSRFCANQPAPGSARCEVHAGSTKERIHVGEDSYFIKGVGSHNSITAFCSPFLPLDWISLENSPEFEELNSSRRWFERLHTASEAWDPSRAPPPADARRDSVGLTSLSSR